MIHIDCIGWQSTSYLRYCHFAWGVACAVKSIVFARGLGKSVHFMRAWGRCGCARKCVGSVWVCRFSIGVCVNAHVYVVWCGVGGIANECVCVGAALALP